MRRLVLVVIVVLLSVLGLNGVHATDDYVNYGLSGGDLLFRDSFEYSNETSFLEKWEYVNPGAIGNSCYIGLGWNAMFMKSGSSFCGIKYREVLPVTSSQGFTVGALYFGGWYGWDVRSAYPINIVIEGGGHTIVVADKYYDSWGKHIHRLYVYVDGSQVLRTDSVSSYSDEWLGYFLLQAKVYSDSIEVKLYQYDFASKKFNVVLSGSVSVGYQFNMNGVTVSYTISEQSVGCCGHLIPNFNVLLEALAMRGVNDELTKHIKQKEFGGVLSLLYGENFFSSIIVRRLETIGGEFFVYNPLVLPDNTNSGLNVKYYYDFTSMSAQDLVNNGWSSYGGVASGEMGVMLGNGASLSRNLPLDVFDFNKGFTIGLLYTPLYRRSSGSLMRLDWGAGYMSTEVYEYFSSWAWPGMNSKYRNYVVGGLVTFTSMGGLSKAVINPGDTLLVKISVKKSLFTYDVYKFDPSSQSYSNIFHNSWVPMPPTFGMYTVLSFFSPNNVRLFHKFVIVDSGDVDVNTLVQMGGLIPPSIPSPNTQTSLVESTDFSNYDSIQSLESEWGVYLSDGDQTKLEFTGDGVIIHGADGQKYSIFKGLDLSLNGDDGHTIVAHLMVDTEDNVPLVRLNYPAGFIEIRNGQVTINGDWASYNLPQVPANTDVYIVVSVNIGKLSVSIFTYDGVSWNSVGQLTVDALIPVYGQPGVEFYTSGQYNLKVYSVDVYSGFSLNPTELLMS